MSKLELKSQGVRVLPCKLTEAELLRTARLHQQALKERVRLEEEAADAKRAWKQRIERAAGTEAELARKIETGSEDRDVVVDTYHDYATFEVLVIRQDTGEEVSRRGMTEAEKQMELLATPREEAVDGKVAEEEMP